MATANSLLPTAGWLRRFGERLRTLWFTKLLGITGAMALFFVAYFWLLNHPQSRPTVMPLIALDALVPFAPAALPLYLSLWIYVSLVPSLLIERRDLASWGAAATGLSVLGLGIFLVWPTAVPAAVVDWSRHPSFALLKSADASGNACPSLHVAFAVFSAGWLERLLRQMHSGRLVRALNWLWCLGILYSTIATRQHVAIDVLAGAVLGGFAAAVHLRFFQPDNCAAVGTTQR